MKQKNNIARLSGQIRLDTNVILQETSRNGEEIGTSHVYLDYVLNKMPYSIIKGDSGFASWIKASTLETDQQWSLKLTLKVHTELKDGTVVPDTDITKVYQHGEVWTQEDTKFFSWTSYHLSGKSWEQE